MMMIFVTISLTETDQNFMIHESTAYLKLAMTILETESSNNKVSLA
jgi:hypothetical protein